MAPAPYSPEFSPLVLGDSFAPLPKYAEASTTVVDLAGLLKVPLQLREDLSSGCGGQIWPAGMTLARHILRHKMGLLQDARILEIGAGGGLVGLAVAAAAVEDMNSQSESITSESPADDGQKIQAGARRPSFQLPLYITDQDVMLELMQHNISLNKMQDRVKALVLNWGEPLPQEIVDFRPNVILAADCVYFEPAFPLLHATLTDLLTLCPDATIYFCFKKRRRADKQFLRKVQKKFQAVEPHDDERDSFSREGLFLYTFRNKEKT